MRFFILTSGLSLSLTLHAKEAPLISVFTPAPEYPQQLIDARYTGKVRVSLTVKSSGVVQNVRIVESPHPLLAEAVRESMVKWRYKPWSEAVDAPANITIMMPVIFGSGGNRPFSSEINIGLKNVPCAHLNYEVANSALGFVEDSLSKVDIFWYTREHLLSSYMELRMSEPERGVLVGQLESAIPSVVKSCKANPDEKYGNYLPEAIRDVMVGAIDDV